jgi:hypothetical protein
MVPIEIPKLVTDTKLIQNDETLIYITFSDGFRFCDTLWKSLMDAYFSQQNYYMLTIPHKCTSTNL